MRPGLSGLVQPTGSWPDVDSRGQDVNDDERQDGAGDRWLHWLSAELARRGSTPGSRLLVLWDVLEEWFASEDFHALIADSLIGFAPLPGPGHPSHAAVAANRHSLRRLLEDLAVEVGAQDPTG